MKKLFLFLLLLVAMGLIAACGRGDNDTPDTPPSDQNGSDTATPAPAETPAPAPDDTPAATGIDGINWDEHVNFTWWMSIPPNDYYSVFSDNPVNRYLEERFNVTFEYEHPVVGTEGDAFALMVGAGRFTDVFSLANYPGSVPQLYYDGTIVDIAQWLDYMPNLSHLINTYPDIARGVFDDDGRILMLPAINEGTVYPWSGLVYRHDILEIMTEGNVQFPSGNDTPTTIEDWEYMLPLFLAFFEMAGFTDFAPFILPPSGFFHFGELMSSFGAYHYTFLRNNEVHMGILEPEFFDYIYTMRNWFEQGWIHQDFAARVGDMFFMPNPPLVFGGAAGAFYGMTMHLGDRLSMPEFGIEVDIRPMPAPLAEGVTQRDKLRRSEGLFGLGRGHAVYTGNPDIGRFLAVIDIFYSVEGGKLRTIGVREEQIAQNDTVMARIGLPDGAYFMDASGNVAMNPNLDEADRATVNGIRFPGIQAIHHVNAVRSAEEINTHSIWGAHDIHTEVHPLPTVLTPTEEEAVILAHNNARINDHRDQMLMMFIMGTTPLTQETWSEFIDQLREFGIEENLAIWQAAYARYLARGR